MAAVCGIDDISPTVALAVAFATVEEIQSVDGLQDEVKENVSRLKLARCLMKEQDISMCVWLDAAAVRLRPL